MSALLEQLGLVSRSVLPSAVRLRARARLPHSDRPLEMELRDHDSGELIDVMSIKDAGRWLQELNYKAFLGAQHVFIRQVSHD
jgi:hypothetical protein